MVLEGSCVHRNSKLVLRDNTYSTIQWDAFTQPELHNFIQILQREEEIYADKVDMVSERHEKRLYSEVPFCIAGQSLGMRLNI